MRVVLWGVLGWAVVVMSTTLICCLVTGRQRDRKRLLYVVAPMLALLALRFGGNWVLSRSGLGWRCAPRDLMDLGWSILLILVVWLCLRVYCDQPEERMGRPGLVALCAAVILAAVLCGLLWFLFVDTPAHDFVTEWEGDQIIVECDSRGDIGCRIAYRYVNPLVRGEQLGYFFTDELVQW